MSQYDEDKTRQITGLEQCLVLCKHRTNGSCCYIAVVSTVIPNMPLAFPGPEPKGDFARDAFGSENCTTAVDTLVTLPACGHTTAFPSPAADVRASTSAPGCPEAQRTAPRGCGNQGCGDQGCLSASAGAELEPRLSHKEAHGPRSLWGAAPLRPQWP